MKKFTAQEVYNLLFEKFSDKYQWLCAREVGNDTGVAGRRLDFVAANCYHSNNLGIYAFEVKISKSDLRRELENPAKHNLFFPEVDYYSIVAPDYVLDKEYKGLIPKQWGVYTVVDGEPDNKPSYIKTVRKPLALHDDNERKISRGFAFSMIRSMKSNGTFRSDAEREELLRLAYEEGASAERMRRNNHSDYKKLYEDVQQQLRLANSALNILGIRPYCALSMGISLDEEAKNKAREIRNNEKIVASIKEMQWNCDSLAKSLQMLSQQLEPLSRIVKGVKDEHIQPT